MNILRDTHNLPKTLKGAVYAIGNFDGIHRGHRAVIDAAIQHAKKTSQLKAIITFEPHSRNFFQPNQPHARITPAKIKAELIKQMGIDILFNLRFNRKLANLSADDFVKNILHQQLAVSHISVGQNFRFGAGRRGDANFLAKMGQKSGFSVDIIKPVMTDESTIEGAISSTAIRSALSQGQIKKAASLLGRWWQIAGAVRHGDQRGQKLGFPTLNLALKDYAPLALGVYAAHCQINNKIYDAVINVGLRPTFGGNKTPLLEAHLLNTTGDFYGAYARVFPLYFIRAEKHFENVDALKTQIAQDCTTAQKLCQNFNTKNTLK